ncbi:MAG: protein kinase [Polyangiaceae bacterium]
MDKRPAAVSIGVVDDERGVARELLRVLTILKRALLKWPLSVFLVAVGVAAGVGYSVVRKPTYTSETIVVYRQGVKMTTESGGTSLSLGVRLQEMLLARSRLESVLDELELYQDVKAKLGPVEAVESFRSDITFKARSTDTFSISYKGRNPEIVQKVTDRLAKSLIEENQKLRVEQAKTQREFLEAQKTQVGTSLKDKERELARFLAEHPEFALDANAQNTAGASIRATSQQKTSQPKDKTLATLERQAERNRVLLEGGVPTPAAPDPGDPALEAAVSQARQTLASAQGELAAKKAKFGDNYPDVISAQTRVNEAQSRLKEAEDAAREARNANAASIPSSDPEANKERLRAELARVNSEIEKRKKLLAGADKTPVDTGTDEADRVVGLETEWARLSRDVGESRDQMNELERNYFRAQIEASSSLGGYSDQVVVLDPPYLPTRPNPPGKQMLVMIGFGLSFALAMIIAILRAVLDTRIYEESDLARVAPIMTVVPKSGSRRWFARG